MEFPSYNNFVCCFPFSIEIKLAKLQNVLSRHITINVTEFILLHPDEINEDEQQESPYISVTLSDPDNCTLESDSDAKMMRFLVMTMVLYGNHSSL